MELQKIQINGEHVTEVDKMKHYTAIYHAMCMTRDCSGNIPGYGDDAVIEFDMGAAAVDYTREG